MKENKKSNGYTTIKIIYRYIECWETPFQETCAKGKETKPISVSVKNQKQQKEVREHLSAEEGKKFI